MKKEIVIKHGMRKEIAEALGVTEQTVYNALRYKTRGEKSEAVRRLAIKKMQVYNQ